MQYPLSRSGQKVAHFWCRALISTAFALLLLTGCVTKVTVDSPPTGPAISNLTPVEQAAFLDKTGQLHLQWPEQRSERQGLNNRRRFFAYAGQGKLIVDMQQAQQLQLAINGQLISLQQPDPQQPFKVDLSAYTRSGDNQLRLVKLEPADASVTLAIPFPTLQHPAQPEVDSRFSAVDQLINAEVAAGFPGAVLLVVHQGRIIKETAYGYANRYDRYGQLLAEPEPMQTDTLFDIASNTKMYATNYALMQLVSHGMLDINQPLSYYLPDYRGEGREQLKVRDLLQHSSGYAPEVHFHRPDNRNGVEFYSLNKANTDYLLVQRVPFATERGRAARYSDINYMLLGILVERLTAQPLDRFVEQRLYQPLGLTRTLFNPLQKGVLAQQIAATELDGNSRGGRVSFPANRNGVLRGEVHDEKAFYALEGVAGHAGLFSTARELAVLMSVAAQQGGYGWQRLFTAATVAQFVSPTSLDHRFGLGWRTATAGDLGWHFGAYASDNAFGHTGWTGAATVIDPTEHLLVVLLTNKKHSPIVPVGNQGYQFSGDSFETGRYGTILSLIYEALMLPAPD